MLTAGLGRENVDCWYRKEECWLLVQEGRMIDCWCGKEECLLLVQEGCYFGKQNGGAGRKNADWKGECCLLVQEGRLLTAGAGRENVDCWCRNGEC